DGPLGDAALVELPKQRLNAGAHFRVRVRPILLQEGDRGFSKLEKPGGGVRPLMDRSRLEPPDQLPSLGSDLFQLVLAVSVNRQLAPGALGNPEISISCFEDGARELRNVRRQESPFPQADALSFQGTRQMRKGSF